jgi:hypothetical protein
MTASKFRQQVIQATNRKSIKKSNPSGYVLALKGHRGEAIRYFKLSEMDPGNMYLKEILRLL